MMINLNRLKRINVNGGDVAHAMKNSDDSFYGFGECYFSYIDKYFIKGWKKHNKMISNLIVPCGNVRFVFFDEKLNFVDDIILGESNYSRLTVYPNLWMAFKGLDKKNIVLNVSNLEHDSSEVDQLPLSNISYAWRS